MEENKIILDEANAKSSVDCRVRQKTADLSKEFYRQLNECIEAGEEMGSQQTARKHNIEGYYNGGWSLVKYNRRKFRRWFKKEILSHFSV